jgi:hypothetical protein
MMVALGKESKMAKDTKNAVFVDGVEYNFEDLTPEQQSMFNHCLDLDRKIGSTQFQLQQLQVGKDAFLRMLKESLEKPKEE